jgi:hypothetical protein
MKTICAYKRVSMRWISGQLTRVVTLGRPQTTERLRCTMYERFDGRPNIIRDLFDRAACIDCDPSRTLSIERPFSFLQSRRSRSSSHLARHPQKHLSDFLLQFFLFVSFLSVSASFSGFFGGDVEEEGEVRCGEGDVRGATPCVGEAFGVGEGDSGEGVAVCEEDGRPGTGIEGSGTGAGKGLLDRCAVLVGRIICL